MELQSPTTFNGFDTDALGGMLEALKQHPEAGHATFRSTTTLDDGGRVTTRVHGYRMDGELYHQHERTFVTVGDEPSEFGAEDTAPAPGEMLMHAAANCILATTNAYAALHGVRLTRLEATIEGDLNLRGLFGLDAAVRPGLNELRVHVTVAGEADEATLRQMVELGWGHSPMRDSIEHGVAVAPTVTVA